MLLSKHFLLQPSLQRLSASLLFMQFSGSVVQPHGGHRREDFWNLDLQIAVKYIFLEFQNFIGSFEEMLTRKIHTTFFCECNQRLRRIGKKKSFKGFSKTRKKKTQRDTVSQLDSRFSFYVTVYQLQKITWKNAC